MTCPGASPAIAERPPWPTIEEPLDLAAALAAAGADLAIVDCLTLWVNNLLHRGDDDAAIEATAADTAASATARGGPTVVISNEVGLGVHPTTELGRRYRDILGRANQRWAAAADTAARRRTRPPLTDPWTSL